jgi:c-di-GMP-binding flagellar brake protein YcgR
MTSVAAGTRLVLRTTDGEIAVRTLADVELEPGWSIPVMANVAALTGADGTIEIVTPIGPVQVEAHLVVTQDRMHLEAGSGDRDEALLAQQRRDDVRGPLSLPLRGAAVDALSREALTEVQLEGSTVSVSAGGLAATLSESLDAPHGARLYLEIELPDGQLVPTVVSVVSLNEGRLRARFVDIAPVDRERLVRMVFAEQRRQLAERLNVRGER